MNLTRGIVLDSTQFKTILPHYLFKYIYIVKGGLSYHLTDIW